MAVQKNIVFKVDIEGTGKAENSIGGLEDRVEKLKQLIESEPIGSKRFNELNRDLQKAQSSIKDVELQFEALDFEQKLTAGSDAIVGIAGGFAVAEGAAALFGESSEALEKTLSKVAGALALTTGLRDLANGVIAMRKLSIATKAQAVFQELNAKATATAATVQKLFAGSVNTTTIGFKALKTAIVATGIGALVVGVGLLVANFDKLAAALSSTTRAQKLANDARLKAIESTSEEISAADKLSKILEDETLSREKKRKEVKKFQDKYPELLSNIDAEKTSLTDINTALGKNIELLKLKAEAEALADVRAEAFKAKAIAQVELRKLNEQFDKNELSNAEQFVSIVSGGGGVLATRAIALKSQKDAIDAANEEIAIIDSLTKATEDKIAVKEEEGAVIAEVTDKTTTETETKKKATEQEKLTRIKTNKFLKDSQKELQKIVQQGIDTRIEGLKTIQTTAEITKDIEIRAAREAAEASAEAWEKYQQERKELTAQQTQEGLGSASEFADGLSSLNDLVLANQIKGLKEGDARRTELERKAFERSKKIQIAQALISAAQGVVSIFSQPLTPLPLKIVEAVALAATTAAQISKIKATQFNGGGSGSIGSVSSAVGGGASDGANGVPINNISNTASLIDQEQQNVTQVVVVETDITNTQNTVAAVTESATF